MAAALTQTSLKGTKRPARQQSGGAKADTQQRHFCLCSSFSAFQQGAHPAIVGLSQDGGRLAAVRPLTMPEPPPLISSTKQGGSITQVTENLHFQRQWSKLPFFFYCNVS